jgi:hypothetical protein
MSFPASKLPQTKHFDIDAENSTTDVGVTNAGSMTLHGTITFSKL